MRATDALATSITRYAIPLLVLITTRSASLTGVAFLLEWLPCLAAFTLGGPLVDRFRADRVLKAAAIARSVLLLAAAVLLLALPPAGTAATVVVMALGAGAGLLSHTSFVAVETLGADLSRQAGDQAHRVQAVQIGIDQSALLAGPLVVGILLMTGQAWPVLTVAAALSLAAAVTAVRTVNPARPAATVDAGVIDQLRTGWCTVRGIPALCWLLVGLIASNLAVAVAQASAPITLVQHFGTSTLTVGTIWSAAGVVALAAVAASRRAIDRHGLWPVGAAAAATACVACFAAALAGHLALYAVAIAILMAGEGALTVVLRTLRARLIPPHAFGATLSVTIVLIILPMPAAGALVALLPSAALPALLLVCAAVQALAMALAFRGLWHHRHTYTAPVAPHASAAPTIAPAA
ncbi:MFS transporter [Streptomyces venezuelae]